MASIRGRCLAAMPAREDVIRERRNVVGGDLAGDHMPKTRANEIAQMAGGAFPAFFIGRISPSFFYRAL
jgi:hypothetical protein